MSRSNWNRNSPDIVGVEFLGVGVVSNVVQFETQHRAVRFRAQRTGPLDQVAVFSGPFTNNPVHPLAHFAGHRTPFIIDLYPVSGFDCTPLVSTTLTSTLTTFQNVLDESGTAPEGNELAFAFDNLFLVPQPGIPSMHVQLAGAASFPLDRHVHSLRLDISTFAPTIVRRIDQNGDFLWNRVLADDWFMSEVRIEAGTTGPYAAWTPSEVRQFASSVGNRRLQMLQAPGITNVFDQLGITVFHVPERRAGTAIVEPPGPWQWVTADLHVPNITGAPAHVTAGAEYVLLYRPPGGPQDFGSSSTWDVSSVKDRRSDSTFVHFTDLDWDSYTVTQAGPIQRALNELQDGLPSVRLSSAGQQTVDTQPYAFTAPTIPFYVTDSRKTRQALAVPAGTTEYSGIRLNVALLKHLGPTDKRRIFVDVVNDADVVLAGPVQVDETTWDAAPLTGNDLYGDEYRTVTLPFGSGVDLNEAGGVNARVYLDPTYTGSIAWRVGALFAHTAPVTGSDQTASIAATGWGFFPPTNAFVQLNLHGHLDLEVSLLSQPPAVTGLDVTVLTQQVTGGPCDPCQFGAVEQCRTEGIPYHHVCWSPTTLTQEKFGYYEVQRREAAVSDQWTTVAILTATGMPVTGAPVTGVPTCFDDYTHMYGSEVCYRVRQQRTDGTLSDFEEEACLTTPTPAGGGLFITAQDDPTLNVVFPEVHDGRLPIERVWRNLDDGQTTLRPVYGRDHFLAFRPSERLGLQFERQLLVSGLCTTTEVPCLNVARSLRDVTTAPVSYLVVRDDCGNRWYAHVSVPTITQLREPILGDLWLVDVVVTELATPVVVPPP